MRDGGDQQIGGAMLKIGDKVWVWDDMELRIKHMLVMRILQPNAMIRHTSYDVGFRGDAQHKWLRMREFELCRTKANCIARIQRIIQDAKS